MARINSFFHKISLVGSLCRSGLFADRDRVAQDWRRSQTFGLAFAAAAVANKAQRLLARGLLRRALRLDARLAVHSLVVDGRARGRGAARARGASAC